MVCISHFKFSVILQNACVAIILVQKDGTGHEDML